MWAPYGNSYVWWLVFLPLGVSNSSLGVVLEENQNPTSWLIILTFGVLRLRVRNSYVLGLVFLHLGVSNSYVWGLDFLHLGVRNSYVWGLVILTFAG